MKSYIKKSVNNCKNIILISLACILIYLILLRPNSSQEHMIDIQPVSEPKWNRNKCKYIMNKSHTSTLKNNNITKSNTDWDYYFPCIYDDIDKEIEEAPIKEDGKYFMIDNADQIAAKNALWVNIVNHHGLERAKLLAPDTFILSKKQDIDRLKKSHYIGKLYIFKKNEQRQEGLKIVKDLTKKHLNKLVKKDKYILAQELLQNPYTINGRKINLRVYVLIVCYQTKMNVYVYNDGFMYYTKKHFEKNNDDHDVNITTGYIDRKVYETNPLTHTEFKEYLDKDRVLTDIEQSLREQDILLSQVVFDRINSMLHDIFICFKGNVCRTGNKLFNNVVV